MKTGRIAIAALILALTLNLNSVNAQQFEHINSKSTTSIDSNKIDIEEFKRNLKVLEEAQAKTASFDEAKISTPTSIEEVKVSEKRNARATASKYLLAPGDSIAISVYGEPDLSQGTVLIRPDGNITAEPFGQLYVAGMDIADLTQALNDKYKKYLINPKISVKLNSMHTAKIYVYGAVQKPGLFQQGRNIEKDGAGNESSFTPELSLASVISNIGGVKYNADLRHAKVTNSATGDSQEYDLMSLLESGNISQDIPVNSGDSIFIPEIQTDAQISDKDFMLIASSSLAPNDFPVRIIGAVKRPGVQKLSSSSPRLNSAIAASEGYMPGANEEVVEIQRITPKGNTASLFVNPNKNDLVLRPNDLVIVADKPTSAAAKGFNFLGGMISPFGTFSGAYNGWAEMFNPARRFNKISG